MYNFLVGESNLRQIVISILCTIFLILPIFLNASAQQGGRDLEAEYCINNWQRDPVRCTEYVPKDYEEKKSEYQAQELERVKQETAQSKSTQESQRLCPIGSHIGKDNFGNQVCLDSKTGQFVSFPNTDQFVSSPNTGQSEIGDNTLIIGIVVFIIILAIIIGATRKRSSHQEFAGKVRIPRIEFTPSTKEIVKEKQNGRCKKCGRIPTHWSFHHIGRRDDNSIHNCMGLCLDCHEDYTRTQRKNHHSEI